MRQAGYDLKSQSGGKGVFAQVVLTVTPSASRGCSIDFGSVKSPWNEAVEFGISYGFEKIVRELGLDQTGVLVEINDISGTFVDTTKMSMVFVAAMAFWKAIEIFPSELPQFDKSVHVFQFPS